MAVSEANRPWRRYALGLLLLLALGAAAILVSTRSTEFPSVQHRNLHVAKGAALLLLAVLLHLLFQRRIPWRWRLRGLALLLGTLLLPSVAFRYVGVSGDLVPLFEWRFRRDPSQAAPAPTSPTPPRGPAATSDYPQFMGRDRTATLPELHLDRDWATTPPKLLWRMPLGPGWGGFAIADGRAVTGQQVGTTEQITCFDVASGKQLWSHPIDAHYKNPLAGEGPRTTPAIHGQNVVFLGAKGDLVCLDAAKGTLRWSVNILRDNNAGLPEWGVSGSPLIHNTTVFVNPGGPDGRALVAYHLDDGKKLWSAGTDSAGYSSPSIATLGGTEQLLIFAGRSVSGHSPANGTEFWKHPWPGGHPHVAVPLQISADSLLVSSGYGYGSERLQLTPPTKAGEPGSWKVERLWKSNRLKSKFANLLFHRGFVYGLDDGTLACLDPADGTQRWKEGRYGHGQLILVGDDLLVMAESGEVILVEANPTSLRELARQPVFSDKTWNPPALAGNLLLIRNDREGAALQLPVKPTRPTLPGSSPRTTAP